MPEPTGTGAPATGAPAGAMPAQEGEQEPPASGAPATGDEPLGEAGRAALEKERQARRDAEQQYRAAQAKLKAYEDAQKSDAEKATERIAELERELATERVSRQEQRLEVAAYAAARKLGYRSPEIAYRLLSPSEVEFTETGTPKNVEKLLAEIAKQEPYLVSGASGGSGLGPQGSPPGAGLDMNTIIRRATGRGV